MNGKPINRTQPERRPSPRGPERFLRRRRSDEPTMFERLLGDVERRWAQRYDDDESPPVSAPASE